MRLYELTIADADGGVYQVERGGLGFVKSSAGQGATFSSLYTPWQTNSQQLIGTNNPSALNIEINLPVSPWHTPQGAALIRVWGLGIKCLGQAANLNPVNNVFKTFSLRAGMSKGLPLANPAQQGIIAQGAIYQAFGNWEGTEQTLDLILISGPSVTNAGVPISWNWQRGQNLQSALAQMLAQAFPASTPNINVSANLIAPSDQTGYYPNIDAFGKWLQRYTKKLGARAHGPGYDGVSIITIGNSIYASDGAGPTPPKTVALAFQDLVGQPTWIEANTIRFPTVLRGDINFGDKVTFPTGVLLPYALTSPDAAYPGSPAASSSAFQGTFVVNREIHHWANFREPDAASWNTSFVASLIPKQTLSP